MSEWDWWNEALAGKTPETTPGTPHWGFFLLRERQMTRTPPEQRKIGGPRHKATTYFHPVSIWQDACGVWNCVIDRPGQKSWLTDVDDIDSVFSRCCRAPMTHDCYLTKVKELENERAEQAA